MQFLDGERIGFGDIIERLFLFEELLKRRCDMPFPIKTIGEGRALSIIGSVESFIRAHLVGMSLEADKEFAEALGMIDLLYYIYLVRDHSEFESLCPHLRYLDKNSGSASQLVKSLITEQGMSNKMMELLCAALVLRDCSGIEVEDPVHSADGTNPDIIASIHGLRWAVAIKTLQSVNPETYTKNIISAVDQIEKSDVAKGIVIINLKNSIDFSKIWKPKETFKDAYDSLLIEGRTLLESVLNTDRLRDSLINYFKDKKAIPVALNYFGGASQIMEFGKPRPTLLRCFELTPFGYVDPSGMAVVNNLNEFLHRR